MRERFRDWNTLDTYPILSLALLTICFFFIPSCFVEDTCMSVKMRHKCWKMT